MNQLDLESRLKDLHLGGIRYFHQITSTNDEATNWLKTDCPDLGLVIADEQISGRGRGCRRWFTPAGSALAFSIVFRAQDQIIQLGEDQNTARLNGLGSLAVCQALKKFYELPAKIKWPNDVLVKRKKLSGVLVEAQWLGNKLDAIVLGIGINVATSSIPPADWDSFNPNPFPATCVETLVGRPVSRMELLYGVLDAILTWRKKLFEPEFISAWQQNLAFQGEWVQVYGPGLEPAIKSGQVIGLEKDGSLQIQDKNGALDSLRVGEIHPSNPPFGGFHIRPVDSSKK